MDVLGSDCVYLSDEICWQDGHSLWSDSWSVGDPVGVPDYDDEFNDMFPNELLQSRDDDGEWLSDVMVSACPDIVAGCCASLAVTVTSASSSEEALALVPHSKDGDHVLSPTDSGHHSIASSTTLAECIVADSPTDGDKISDTFDEHTSELSSRVENSDDIHVAALTAASCMMVNNKPSKMKTKSRVVNTEFISQRPQRVAARRAEIALAGEESDCDIDDDDVDGVDDARLRSRCYLPATETTMSRRGRSRVAEVNRNALNARMNRQKKKAYMASLESQKARLLYENKRMKSALSSLVSERSDLIDEVRYLKSVLANDSILAQLVQNIKGPQLKLSSRFDGAAQKRKDAEFDHNYGPATKQGESSVKAAGGICLHVTENRLTMELCHHCARMHAGADDGDSHSCSDS